MDGKLKRVPIKEELVKLCNGSFVDAIILQQMLYWSERVKDFDKFITEEKIRSQKHDIEITMELTRGWIYKTSEELSEETMLGLSKSSMRRHLQKLIKMGYMEERKNPIYKWDQTLQYRMNINKIREDLGNLGFVLDGYPISKMNNGSSIIESPCSNMKIQVIDLETQGINSELQYQRLQPEITTDINIGGNKNRKEDKKNKYEKFYL
jgi:hypothetical protein